MNPDLLAFLTAVAGPLLTAVSVIFGSWLGRRQGLKAAETAAEEAANEAREVVTADWTAYTKLLMQRLGAVESRAGTAEKRLDSAEMRAEKAEERASIWESRYKMAMIYIRDLIGWASGVSHMSVMPEAPAELQSDL